MRKSFILLLAVVGLSSCVEKDTYNQYYSIDSNVWKTNNSIEFNVEIEDTISQNNIFINIRNNKDYEFSNLFLISQIQFPDGYRVVDTLEYEMTDKTGVFLGSGYTDIKENKLFYKEKVRFNQSGNYLIKVDQAMRKNGNIQGLDSLKGITDVGLSIESLIE
jgi:gliding motility-associated lipoprotein GldH